MPGDVVIRRTADGWQVGEERLPGLLEAMILADLLDDDGPRSATAGGKAGPADQDTEFDRLRTTVTQLEHALACRVTIEQAIGVLAERHRVKPRSAFELLRSVARSRGRRVHEVAGDVVASATNPLLPLPPELSR